MKYLKKADIVLAVILVIAGCCSPFLLRKNAGESALQAEVVQNGETIYTLSLDKDCRIEIKTEDGEYNTLVIENGSLYIEDANCKGKDCVKTGKINKAGQIIACLPHKLLVKITGADEDMPDAVIK